jgi:hypothetical protein
MRDEERTLEGVLKWEKLKKEECERRAVKTSCLFP